MPKKRFSLTKKMQKLRDFQRDLRREVKQAREEIRDFDVIEYHTKELLHYKTKGKIADAYIFEKKSNNAWKKSDLHKMLETIKKENPGKRIQLVSKDGDRHYSHNASTDIDKICNEFYDDGPEPEDFCKCFTWWWRR